MNLNRYRKFIVAAVGALVVGLTAAFGNDVPSWFNTVIAVLTALGVYQVPNTNGLH